MPLLLVALLPIAIGAGSFNSIINSAISKAVSPDEVGGILGIGAGLESSTRVIMPAVASYLLGAFGPSSPGYMGSVILFIVFAFAYVRLIAKPDVIESPLPMGEG